MGTSHDRDIEGKSGCALTVVASTWQKVTADALWCSSGDALPSIADSKPRTVQRMIARSETCWLRRTRRANVTRNMEQCASGRWPPSELAFTQRAAVKLRTGRWAAGSQPRATKANEEHWDACGERAKTWTVRLGCNGGGEGVRRGCLPRYAPLISPSSTLDAITPCGGACSITIHPRQPLLGRSPACINGRLHCSAADILWPVCGVRLAGMQGGPRRLQMTHHQPSSAHHQNDLWPSCVGRIPTRLSSIPLCLGILPLTRPR
jgi:hypothetical protein